MENKEKKELETVDSTTATALTTGISVQDFQSFFYLINAKPDRETKFFHENKVVSITNVIELNDLMQEKLRLHDIVTSQVSVVVSLSNDRTLEYGTWDKFVDEKWHTSAITKSVMLMWDFTVNLPGYKFPQRHTVKLRLGSKLKPKDMFELVMNHEDEGQLYDAFSHAICSIDFINPVISGEIFRIVENWHKALPKNFYSSKLHQFLRKHSKKIETVVIFFVMTAGSIVLFGAGRMYLSYIWDDVNSQLFSARIFGGLLMSVLFLFVIHQAGIFWAHGTAKFIERLKTSTLFNFTKGDANANEENDKKNNQITRAIGIKLALTIILNIVAYLSDHGWDFLMKISQK